MNIQLLKLKRAAILLAGIFVSSIPTMAHADWSIVGLSTLGGGGQAMGLNDSGQVVGYARPSSHQGYHAFMTGPNGIGITDLHTLISGIGGGDTHVSIAYDINDSGQVVMWDTLHRSFITGPNGIGVTELDRLNAVPQGINNSGQVVGLLTDPVHPFITGPNGIGITDLMKTTSGSGGANAINDSGQVAGDFNGHAFITGPNSIDMIDLGTFGGSQATARDINNSGQVGGEYVTDHALHAFITGPNGVGMTELGTLGGWSSYVTGINDSGEAVGGAQTENGVLYSPFLYSHGGITDLSLLDVVVNAGWTHLNVVDINNNGQIAGTGWNSHGQEQFFLLSYTPDTIFTPNPIFIPTTPPPIPEPATWAMLFAGLGMLWLIMRRRKETTI